MSETCVPPPTVLRTRRYALPQASCSSCNRVELEVGEVEYDIDNFGPVLMSVTFCRSCSFKDADVLSLSAHDPTVTSVKITSANDLKIGVVRGNTATIVVPEPGISIHPGQNNEGFISNVEGVLARIEDVGRLLSSSLEGRRKQKADLVLRNTERARKGRLRLTLALKDPFGNSTIISRKAKRPRIRARELKNLKYGEHAIAAKKRS